MSLRSFAQSKPDEQEVHPLHKSRSNKPSHRQRKRRRQQRHPHRQPRQYQRQLLLSERLELLLLPNLLEPQQARLAQLDSRLDRRPEPMPLLVQSAKLLRRAKKGAHLSPSRLRKMASALR